MTAVFSHGRLRLYLLRLLDDGPKHGYELIRLLENRFLGLYAPSAGTIYPRLQRLEVEGLVTHDKVGGRKIYQITETGRAELRQRAAELAILESDIRASVADLATMAGEIQDEVRGSVRDLKEELRAIVRQTRRGRRDSSSPTPSGSPLHLPAAAADPGTAVPGTADPGTADPGTAVPGTAYPGTEPPGLAGPGNEPPGNDPAAQFDRHLTAFVAEVRALVRSLRLTEAQLRMAIRALDGTLDGLRRLLR